MLRACKKRQLARLRRTSATQKTNLARSRLIKERPWTSHSPFEKCATILTSPELKCTQSLRQRKAFFRCRIFSQHNICDKPRSLRASNQHCNLNEYKRGELNAPPLHRSKLPSVPVHPGQPRRKIRANLITKTANANHCEITHQPSGQLRNEIARPFRECVE